MKRVAKQNAQQKAYQAIAVAIQKGSYTPGERLSVRALALEMGVSITPVREAVLKLEALGAVAGIGTRAFGIPMRTPTEVGQIYALRMMVEGQAAAEAAQKITSGEIEALRALEARARKAYKNQEIRAVVTLNEEFHFAIYRAARNQPLMDVIELLWLRCGPLLPTVYGIYKAVRQISPDLAFESSNHGPLIEGLERRNDEGARAAALYDIELGLRSYTAATASLDAAIAEFSRRSNDTSHLKKGILAR